MRKAPFPWTSKKVGELFIPTFARGSCEGSMMPSMRLLVLAVVCLAIYAFHTAAGSDAAMTESNDVVPEVTGEGPCHVHWGFCMPGWLVAARSSCLVFTGAAAELSDSLLLEKPVEKVRAMCIG